MNVQPPLHPGSSTTTLNVATVHSEATHRSVACYQPDGWVHLATLTLTRRATLNTGLGDTEELSAGVNWVFVVLAIGLAIAAWSTAAAADSITAAEVAAGAGFGVIAYAMFTWLGRSLWLNDDLPDQLSLNMSWGYYATLAVGVLLIFVPSMLAPAEPEQ